MSGAFNPVAGTRLAVNALRLDDELRSIFLSGLEAMSSEEAADVLADLEEANRRLPSLLDMIYESGLAPIGLSASLAISNDTQQPRLSTSHDDSPAAHWAESSGGLEYLMELQSSWLGIRQETAWVGQQLELSLLLFRLSIRFCESVLFSTVETRKAVTKSFSELLLAVNSLSSRLPTLERVSPVGSDTAISAVRAAIAAADSAYDSLNKAARQVAELAEANAAARANETAHQEARRKKSGREVG